MQTHPMPKTSEEFARRREEIAEEARRAERRFTILQTLCLVLAFAALLLSAIGLGARLGDKTPETGPTVTTTDAPLAPRTLCQEIADQPGLWQCWDPRAEDSEG